MADNSSDPTVTSRRIVANLFLTLDGVMEAPERWQTPYFNPEMGEAISAGFAESDALLMGGRLYREWVQYWPGVQGDPIADLMNGMPKYVVSNTLQRVDWSNSTLIQGDVARQVSNLKAREGKDIAVSGSATLVRWLMREGLLDELRLLIVPVLVGTGRRLFEGDTPPGSLELVSARPFETGVVYLTYRPARS